MNSDGYSSSYRPLTEAGQWWALRNPASLVQIVQAGESREFNGTSVRIWNSREEGVDATYIILDRKEFEYLWYSTNFIPYAPENTYRMGQIYIDPVTERLFFIGMPDEQDRVCVLASWVVNDGHFRRAVLYQDGPPRAASPATEFVPLILGDEFD